MAGAAANVPGVLAQFAYERSVEPSVQDAKPFEVADAAALLPPNHAFAFRKLYMTAKEGKYSDINLNNN